MRTWTAIGLWTGMMLLAGCGGSTAPEEKTVPGPPPYRAEEPTGPQPTSGSAPQISPDGQWIAFAGAEAGEQQRIWVRPTANPGEAKPIEGTQQAMPLFWTPDSRRVVYWIRGALESIPREGGERTVLALSKLARPGAWTANGALLFSPAANEPLFEVKPPSRDERQLTTLGKDEFGHGSPQVLPDGSILLHVVRGDAYQNTVEVANSSGTRRKVLFENPSPAAYTEFDGAGHLIWARGTALFSRRFDAKSGRLMGERTTIAEDVAPSGAGGVVRPFSASNGGGVAYLGGPRWRLRWYDRSGQPGETLPPGISGRNPALSHDGKTLVLDVLDAESETTDLWLVPLDTNQPRQLTKEWGNETAAVFSPDDSKLAYAVPQGKEGGVYEIPASGGPGRRIADVAAFAAEDWRDDKLLYCGGKLSLRLLPLMGGPPLNVEPADVRSCQASFSPDGKWIAYSANVSGRFEVYVRSAVESGRRIGVSTTGGVQPQWSEDGKEIFYLGTDGRLSVVPVTVGDLFHAGPPKALIALPLTSLRASRNDYVAARDGARFLVRLPQEGTERPRIAVLRLGPH